MRVAGLVAVFTVLAVTALGQMDGNPDNWCREGFFARESKDFRVATVKRPGPARAYFYGDDPSGCPDEETCRQKAYLVPGDKVVVNRTRGGFACAWYTPRRGTATVGWLKVAELTFAKPVIVAGVSPWLGDWKYADNRISFTENKLSGFVNVTGNAIWRGVGDNVHVGELDGRYQPANGVIEYSDGTGEYDCRATLTLIDKFLIVGDNLNCGGVNVSFSGVYVRIARF
jgi:hypothetical protein